MPCLALPNLVSVVKTPPSALRLNNPLVECSGLPPNPRSLNHSLGAKVLSVRQPKSNLSSSNLEDQAEASEAALCLALSHSNSSNNSRVATGVWEVSRAASVLPSNSLRVLRNHRAIKVLNPTLVQHKGKAVAASVPHSRVINLNNMVVNKGVSKMCNPKTSNNLKNHRPNLPPKTT